ASCRRYSSSSPPVSAPPPRYRRESSPMAPVDRLLLPDRLSQTVPPAACPHQRTPVAPSWPPRIIAVTSEIRTGQRQELFFEAPSNQGVLYCFCQVDPWGRIQGRLLWVRLYLQPTFGGKIDRLYLDHMLVRLS